MKSTSKSLDDCFKYEPDIKRLTKANSFTHEGRVIYIVKKTPEGKASKAYVAYDHATKILLMSHLDKDFLIEYIREQDMSILSDDSSLY